MFQSEARVRKDTIIGFNIHYDRQNLFKIVSRKIILAKKSNNNGQSIVNNNQVDVGTAKSLLKTTCWFRVRVHVIY